MTKRYFRRLSALRSLCFFSLAILVAGCSSNKEKSDRPENPFRASSDLGPSTPQSEAQLKVEADVAYRRANASLVQTDYETSITRYDQLIARYPFTEYATQAELEKIFAQYRSYKPDEAVLGADRFLREHPRHPHADYVYYLKGLIDSSRNSSISDFLPLDTSKKDVLNERRAFDDFALLLQRYPLSAYAGDARKRMIYLRNRIAAHELSIIRFYVKRQAWVAVSKRAENLLVEFPGAPATADALKLLQLSYDKLGLKPQSEDIGRLIAANTDTIKQASLPKAKPIPRSVIGVAPKSGADGLPAVPLATAAAPGTAIAAAPASTPAPEAPKGFFGTIGGYLDSLNKTYVLDKPATPAPGTAPVGTPSTTEAVRPSPSTSNPNGDASLSSGPYSGEPTVIDIPPVFGDSVAAPAKTPAASTSPTPPANAQPSPTAAVPATAAATTPTAEPKKKGGFLDFLNKTYVIGGPKTASEETTSPPPTPAPAPAPPTPVAPAAPPTKAPAAEVPAAAPAESRSVLQRFGDFFTTEHTLVLPTSDSKPDATGEAAKPGESKVKVYLDYEGADGKPATVTTDTKPAEPAPAN